MIDNAPGYLRKAIFVVSSGRWCGNFISGYCYLFYHGRHSFLYVYVNVIDLGNTKENFMCPVNKKIAFIGRIACC